MDLQVGGASKFSVSKAGGAVAAAGTASNVSYAAGQANLGLYSRATNFLNIAVGGVPRVDVTTTGFVLGGPLVLNGNLNSLTGGNLSYIYSDADNTVALRLGTSPQAFRVYNTFTDASNYERGFARWNSNVFEIGTEFLGSGSARILALTQSSTAGQDIQFKINSNAAGFNKLAFTHITETHILWRPYVGGGTTPHLAFVNDMQLGWSSSATDAATASDVGLYRSAAGVLQVNNGTTSTTKAGAALEFIEQTAPAAPATENVRIYAEDDGAGKTRLMARFATGAAVQIAIEP
jgi:hypothetical protein